MSIHLKRIVFFFCILNFGLGCCLGTRANADDNLMHRIFIGMIFNNSFPAIGGRVIFNGSGLPAVEIFNEVAWDAQVIPGKIYLVAVTDSKGEYRAGFSSNLYFIYPEKYGYQFDPSGSWVSHNDGIQDFTAYKHTISGTVLHNGKGLENVEIYGDVYVKDQFVKKLLATTNSNGYYETEENAGVSFALTPQLSGYEFKPPDIPIVGSQYLHEKQDFIAEKLAIVTISGNVIWKNHFNTTIPSNPLPMVAMEAWTEDGSLSSRSVTDANGNYSLSVPDGWTGWVKPVLSGFEFWPERIDYNTLKENKTQDYYAPSYWGQTVPPTGHVYKITVSVKSPGGALLPPSEKFIIWFNGINHANGSKVYCQIVTVPTNLGECSLSQPSGWIGDIVPTNFEGGVNYTFAPAFYHMNEILTSDLTFSFEATK